MTQLALLLALGLLGLVLSFGFGRLEVKRGSVSATVKRAEGALERASLALLRLGGGRGMMLLLVPAFGLSGFALVNASPAAVSSGGKAAFLSICLLAGAGSALVHARFALGLGARAASSAAAARAVGSCRSVRPLIRSAVAIAVFGDGLGLLGVAAAFASLFAIRGGFAAASPPPQLAAEIVRMLPAFALGAAVTALALAREGSVAGTAARVGAAQAAELDRALVPGDAQDPSLLARLMGHLVGELLPSALSSYLCGVVTTISAAMLALSSTAGSEHPLTSLVLVVLVRAFGALGSVCGVLAARSNEDEPAVRALLRGQASAFAVALFGLGAALFWLQRAHWGALFVAGASGLLSVVLVALATGWSLRARTFTAREEGGKGSSDAARTARGISAGFMRASPALVALALIFAVVERGLTSYAPAGLLLASFAAGALALAPYALSMSGFGLLALHTRGVVSLARLERERAPQLSRLDDASSAGKAMGSTHTSLALALSVLLGLASLAGGATSASGFGPAGIAVALGVALVLVFGARAMQLAVMGARLVTLEIERQLRDAPRANSTVALSADFTPSYKGCVDAAHEAAQRASVVELGLLMLSPFLLGGLLRWLGVPAGDAALSSFGVAAVAAGLILTLGGRATRAVLGEQRPRLRGGDSDSATTQPESFGDLLGATAATSVEALGLVLALTILCLAPLLR